MTSPVTTETNALGQNRHTHNADGSAPVQTRSERFKSFDVADFPAVTGREAEWKFTPVRRLESLLNDSLDGSRVDVTDPGVAGVTVSWVGRDDARIGAAGKPEDRASANAWTAFEEALLIEVSGEEAKTAAVTRENFGTNPRGGHVIIDVKPHAQGLIILNHLGAAQLAENVEILVGEGARVTVLTVQQWDDDAIHLSSHFGSVGRDAYLKHIVVSLGGSIVRVNPSVHLNEQGAEGELFGLYYADEGQFLEQQVFVDHNAPRTRSRVNYKGALQGEGAHTVWIGDVLIQQHAEGTDSYEQNRNLILSDGTRADSIPNLEIETGDIEGAGHASATGRFDDEQLFYLQARGISELVARRLVVHGFLNEIVQEIDDEETADRLRDALEEELNRSANILSVPTAESARRGDEQE